MQKTKPQLSLITPAHVCNILTCILITLMLLETIIAPVHFTCCGWVFSGDVLTIPLGYLIIHTITDNFGIHQGRYVLWLSYFVHVLAIAMTWVSQQLPTASTSPVTATFFEQLLGGEGLLQLGTASIHTATLVIAVTCAASIRELTRYHAAISYLLTIILAPWLATCITFACTLSIRHTPLDGIHTLGYYNYSILGPPIMQTTIGLLGIPAVYSCRYLIQKLIIAKQEN